MADFTPQEIKDMNSDPPIISPQLRRKINEKKAEANLAAGRGLLYTGNNPPTTPSAAPAQVQQVVNPPVQPPTRPGDNGPLQPVIMLDDQIGNLLQQMGSIEGQLHSSFGQLLGQARNVVAQADNKIMAPVAKGMRDALATVQGVDHNLDVQLTQSGADLAQSFQAGFGNEAVATQGVPANNTFPQGGPKTAQVRARLVAGYGYTPEMAAKEIVAEDKTTLPKVTLEANAIPNSKMVLGPDGKEYREYAPSRMLGEFTTDDQSYAQCSYPYRPVLDQWSGNVVCRVDGTTPVQPVADLGPQSVYKHELTPTPSKPSSDCDNAQRVWICNLPDMSPPTGEKKAEDCKPKEWTLYRTREGVCYTLPKGSSKRSSDDELVTEGEFSQDWVDRIASQCGKRKEEDKTQTPSGGESPTPISLDSCTQDGLLLKLIQGSSVRGILKSLGIDSESIKAATKMSYADALANPGKAAINTLLSHFAVAFERVISPIDTLIETLSTCDGTSVNETVVLAVTELCKYISGSALDPYTTPIRYDRDFRCPYLLPSAAEAVAAYMSNQINGDRLQCLIRANGLKWEQYLPVIAANRSKHSPLDLAALYRRGILNDGQYRDKIRELGFLWSDEPNQILEVTKPLPGPADIIRFMLRDVANEKVVARFRLGDGFEDNFKGKLKEYADFQGLDTEQMDLYWKAHWSIPSPTQLYEMYRRLRHSDRKGGEAQLVDDIKTALIQQDILPFWQDDLLKLATLPLNRTDSKRAFEINEINEQQLLDSFYAGGYSDKDAEILVKFTKKQKRLKFARHPAVTKYSKGLITRDELTELLTFEGAEQQDIDYATSRGKMLARSNMRDKCGQAVKRRFFLAEIDSGDISTKLVQLGIDSDIAASLSGAWQCERSARGKQLPLLRLSKLYRSGIIKADEFTRRIVTLGYDAEQAMYILAEQDGLKDEEKRRKDEAKAAKAAKDAEKKRKDVEAQVRKQAAQEKAQGNAEKAAAKEAQAAANKLENQIEKANRQAAAALTKAQAVLHDREDNLLDIAAAAAKATGENLGNALRAVRSCFNSLKRADRGVDSVLEIGLRTAKLGGYEELTAFCGLWQNAVNASAGVDEGITPTV